MSDYCDDESIQFRQFDNISELSVAKAKVTILEEDAKHESDLAEVIEDATTVKTKRACLSPLFIKFVLHLYKMGETLAFLC